MGHGTDFPFLAGDSKMARLLREHDWAGSALGPPAGWPQSLRSVVHLMLGSAFPMFVGWGPKLHTLYNDGYAEIMGAKHPGGLGQPFLDIWAEIRSDLQPLVRRAMGGEAFFMENLPLRMRRHGYDEDTWFTFSWSPVLNEDGHIAGMYCACTETTRMQLAQQALREADRQKDAYLATLAHELRNPMAPIRNAAHLLASPLGSEAARASAVQTIVRQAAHMARLLDDLMDLARVTQGRVRLKKERVEVGTLVLAAVEATRPLADAKRHALQIRVADPAVALVVDPVRIVQVLSNLLNNAVKYTEPGGDIRLTVQSQPGRICFEVADNGVGIGEAALRKLFVMFSQDKASLGHADGGLGIGLALSRSLIELHGGSVTASSAGPGHGSVFTVELPLPAEPVRPPPAAPERAPVIPRVVLLADDNADARDTLAELLRLDGHTVLTARDGHEAALLALQHRPDAMVLDIGMPGASGYDVARRVRAQPWGGVPLLIAATGWGRDEDRRQASDAGFDAHLTKPFDPAALTDLLARPQRDAGRTMNADSTVDDPR